jgi:acid phosphatase type 7
MSHRRIRHISLIVGIVVVAALGGVLLWPAASRTPAKGDRRIRPLAQATSEASAVSPAPDPSATSSATPSAEPSSGAAVSSPTESPAAAPSPSAVEESTVPAYVIAAAGDIACDPTNEYFRRGRGTARWCRQEDTANLVREIDPDMVVPLGDTQYDEGTLAQYRSSYAASWGKFKSITYPVLGNHEYYDGKPSGYFDYFGPQAGDAYRGWYSMNRAGWHLMILNSNCTYEVDCRPGSAQYEWLEQDLASNASTCQVAFMHHPLFSSGPHGSERSVTPLWRVLREAGVELVLVAHEHIYERFAKQNADGERDPDGIRQITVGTGGAEHYWVERRKANSIKSNAKTFGVLKLSLSASSYEWRFMGVGRRAFTDSGTDVCR